MRITLLLLTAISLTACKNDEPWTTEKVMDVHARQCRNSGLHEGSTAYHACMTRRYETYAYEKDMREKREAAQAAAKAAAERD